MKAKLQAILSTIGKDIADTYRRLKVLILVAGAALIYLEFNNIKEALLLYSAKKEDQKTNDESEKLQQKENTANAQADELVKKAENENSKDDWYKK